MPACPHIPRPHSTFLKWVFAMLASLCCVYTTLYNSYLTFNACNVLVIWFILTLSDTPSPYPYSPKICKFHPPLFCPHPPLSWVLLAVCSRYGERKFKLLAGGKAPGLVLWRWTETTTFMACTPNQCLLTTTLDYIGHRFIVKDEFNDSLKDLIICHKLKFSNFHLCNLMM